MPLFFLSYARIPGDRRSGPDPDRLVFDFYMRLRNRVAAYAGVSGPDAGFVELPGTTGEEVAEALSRCRVFVPLYSKRYFTDPQCGRQWTSVTRGAAPAAAPRIVPVLWTPYPATSVPQAVQETPAVPESAADGEDGYATMGLHQLLDLEEGQAQQVVEWLARRIVATAAGARPHGDPDPAALARLPDAFATLPPSPPLRITVLAPSEGRLPIGREPSRYGPDPLDWSPYGPVAGGPVAEQVRELARNLRFDPEVVSFDKALVELRGTGTPAAPWILIVDPWALQDAEAARQAGAFDAAHRPWTAVLTALADDDPQTKEHSERLRGLLESTFPRFVREGRIGQQTAVRGLGAADTFAQWFCELVESVYMRYLRYIQPRSSLGSSDRGIGPGADGGGSGTDEGGGAEAGR
ncbi:FxsC protein [Streptomyces jumonjinensis]|uniref:FxsC protein n=1 Tax=Streptomyces jumonjinensis TaxID=1945 RepID=A0A646KH02_STRJU|nr:FxsC protein [Streptomyces jumonjinensis]MQT01277.1 FxsC protein [Streptomyces jumonjinensis]